MKVKELIEELQKQNPDSVVEVFDSEGFSVEAENVNGNPASCATPVEIS